MLDFLGCIRCRIRRVWKGRHKKETTLELRSAVAAGCILHRGSLSIWPSTESTLQKGSSCMYVYPFQEISVILS